MIKEKIGIEYLEELDRVREYIPMTMDFMFKSVMQKNPNILEKFLVDLMNLKIDKNDFIIFLDKELIKGNIKEKGKVVDINVKFGDKYLIQIEVNRSKYQIVKVRNDLYLEKIDTLRLEINNNYVKDFDTKYLYQLNLNASDEEDKNVGLSSLVEYDRINKVITSDRIEKYSANLAYFYNAFYNKDEEMGFSQIFMAGLMSKSYTELYKIMSIILTDKELNKFMEDVIIMTNEELLYNIHYWEKKKLDALVEHNIKEDARKTGHAEGHAEGIEANKREIIQNMLKEHTEYEYISKITGKTIEEIKEIEKMMKEE